MPRLIITFKPQGEMDFNQVLKHHIQAYIYECLRDTPYDLLHQTPTYKFFTFSDIYPAEDFKPHKDYSFFISSPDRNLIRILKSKIKEMDSIRFGHLEGEIKKLSLISPKITKLRFISASPVVVSHNHKYLSLYHGSPLSLYLDRLKINAIDKYKTFYNEDPHLSGELFDRMVIRKSVSCRIEDKGNSYDIIGTMWRVLEKSVYDGKEELKFYRFLFDSGIGVKNSLGFGALNQHPSTLKNF